MKRLLFFLLFLLPFWGSNFAEARKRPGRHNVRSYTRKDGTHVRAHQRGSGAVLSRGARGGGGSFEDDEPPTGMTRAEEVAHGQANPINVDMGYGTSHDVTLQRENQAKEAELARIAKVKALSSSLSRFSGRCSLVEDGETLLVLREGTPIKIRLAGIDAPEEGQRWASESTDNLNRWALGKVVVVSPQKVGTDGVIVAAVQSGNRALSTVQVAYGLAWCLSEDVASDSSLKDWQSAAKAKKIGLWREVAPIAPWQWRQMKAAKQ